VSRGCVEIRDQRDAKVLELVRPRGLLVERVWILARDDRPVGCIYWEALYDPSGRLLAVIERHSRGLGSIGGPVDYTISDPAGTELATIADFRHVAKRSLGAANRKMLRKRFGSGQPDEHVLEITAPVDDDLRMLMLGAAAAVYLALQRPAVDGSD
jgi:hypothetical protein